MSSFPLIETFPSLDSISGLVHGFILRSPEIDVDTDRETALACLAPFYAEQLSLLGISRDQLATGEQVHGAVIGRAGTLRFKSCGPDRAGSTLHSSSRLRD